MAKLLWLNGIYPYWVPDPPEPEKILFSNLPKEQQYWRRTAVPDNWETLPVRTRNKFIQQEVERMFVTGVHFMNNGEVVYMPPDAYFYFNWWQMKDGNYPDFRKSQLIEYYFENFSEDIPNCIGTFSFKKRRDGRTTRRMCRMIWKAIQPKNRNSKLGMQSKTGTDAKDICWQTLLTGYKGLPVWVKPDQSGSSDPQTKLVFAKPAQRLSRSNVKKVQEEASDDKDSLNTTVNYRDTTVDAYDGDELLDYTCDEAAKWVKANVLRAFTTYTKCFWKDGKKVGHWHGISSPSQKNGPEHDRSVVLWNMGDPAKHLEIHADGSFTVKKKSWFILRFFTGALEGYGGACDKYGECDPVLARQMIQEEIDNAEDDEMREEIKRQLPFTIEDILLNINDLIFNSGFQMNARKIYLEGIKVRPGGGPKYVFGNLEWYDMERFGKVYFKPSLNQDDFSETGRWAFQQQPPEHMRNRMVSKKKLRNNIWLPPEDSEAIIGIDPYDYRRTESSNKSEGAAIGGAVLDFHDHGLKDRIFFAYLFRPSAPNVYYEDMLKSCWYLSAYGQVESKNKNIIDFFEDSDCMDILLPKNIKQPDSEHKGNATTVPLIDEMSTLLDQYYSDNDILEDMWLDFLLGDNLVFNPGHTLKAHLTMAQGQWLLGRIKRRLQMRTKKFKKTTTLGTQLNRAVANVYGINY